MCIAHSGLRRGLVGVLGVVLGLASNALLSCSRPQEPGQVAPARPTVPAEVYVLPSEGTSSLVRSLEAGRDSEGQVTVTGSLLLPSRTNIWVDLFAEKPKIREQPLGHSESYLGSGGALQAGPFDLPEPGRYRVLVTAYFNGAWQSPEILALVGTSGVKLPKSALEPDDPEFPQSGGHLEYWGSVSVPALSPELKAIQAVKSAKLFVKGKGQAVDTVDEIVKYFDAPGLQFYPGEWSARLGADGTWIVSLQHKWGEEQKTANWECDPRTRRVKYLDPEAKTLSWLPAE
jgi:hypothetical protein